MSWATSAAVNAWICVLLRVRIAICCGGIPPDSSVLMRAATARACAWRFCSARGRGSCGVAHLLDTWTLGEPDAPLLAANGLASSDCCRMIACARSRISWRERRFSDRAYRLAPAVEPKRSMFAGVAPMKPKMLWRGSPTTVTRSSPAPKSVCKNRHCASLVSWNSSTMQCRNRPRSSAASFGSSSMPRRASRKRSAYVSAKRRAKRS